MTNNTKNGFLKQGFLFFETVNSNFNLILNIASELIEKHPQILDWIKRDQDKYCKEKKRLRVFDKQFEESKTVPLFSESELKKMLEAINDDEITLDAGRPRMQPVIVFLFLLFRGYHTSFCKKHSADLLMESISIRSWLAKYGVGEFPGITTILENVNMVSNETREKLLTLQCGMVFEEGLDNFKESFVDSTTVAGNTAYPTDISILYKLVSRSYSNMKKICELLNLPMSESYFKEWFSEMKSCVFSLAMGKLKKPKKKKVCRKLMKLTMKIENRLSQKYNHFQSEVEYILSGLRPTLRTRLSKIWEEIKLDLDDSIKVLEYTQGGIIDGKKYKSRDKILSISDGDVAFIIKGSLRSAVVGYKPQLARSKNGIITALELPAGNAPDFQELIPVMKQIIRRTKIIPEMLSVDDGYSSFHNRKWLEKIGVKTKSFNGINGRRLTSDEDWESEVYKAARADRSLIEGLISTLKLVQEFGKSKRRGLENNRAEMLEKIIAHNFSRIGMLRHKRHEKERREALFESRDAA